MKFNLKDIPKSVKTLIKSRILVTRPDYVPNDLEQKLSIDILYCGLSLILAILLGILTKELPIILMLLSITLMLFILFLRDRSIVYNFKYIFISGICADKESANLGKSVKLYVIQQPDETIYQVTLPDKKTHYKVGMEIHLYVLNTTKIYEYNGSWVIPTVFHYTIVPGKLPKTVNAEKK